jgi:hypothetical protein
LDRCSAKCITGRRDPKHPKAKIRNIARSSPESLAQKVMFIKFWRLPLLKGHIEANSLNASQRESHRGREHPKRLVRLLRFRDGKSTVATTSQSSVAQKIGKQINFILGRLPETALVVIRTAKMRNQGILVYMGKIEDKWTQRSVQF